jgi:hypothetical protein
MDEHVQALSRLTGSGDWPDRWLSVPEFVARLDQLGWWRRLGPAGTAGQKEAFLRAALAVGAGEGTLLWARVGSRYKHLARLTDEDFRGLVAFNRDARGAAEVARAALSGLLPHDLSGRGPTVGTAGGG